MSSAKVKYVYMGLINFYQVYKGSCDSHEYDLIVGWYRE